MDDYDFFADNLSQRKYFYNHSNSLFHIEPDKIVMKIKNPNVPPRHKIRIINHTDFSQKCYVLPLESDQFLANFRNQELIAPGLCMHVEVAMILKPYQDIVPERTWLKVFCYDDTNLMIPIETADPNSPRPNRIPRLMDFGIVPLCESESFKIMVSPNANESTISNVTILEPHVDVVVRHVQGTPPQHPSYVEVTYQPTSYTTMRCTIIIYSPIYENNEYPVVTFTGRCMPPPFKDHIQNFIRNKLDFIHELQNELKKRKVMFLRGESKERLQVKDKKEEHPVQGLESEREKEDLSVLRGPLGRKDEEDEQLKICADKQFQKDVEEIRSKAKLIKIHPTMENLGSSGNEELKYNFEIDWEQYMKLRALPVDDSVLTLDEQRSYRHRIIKLPECRPESKVTKHPVCSEWFTRFRPLCKFIQAVRQIMIKNRLLNQLSKLRQYVNEVKSKLNAEDKTEDTQTEDERPSIKFFGSDFQYVPPIAADTTQIEDSWFRSDYGEGDY